MPIFVPNSAGLIAASISNTTDETASNQILIYNHNFPNWDELWEAVRFALEKMYGPITELKYDSAWSDDIKIKFNYTQTGKEKREYIGWVMITEYPKLIALSINPLWRSGHPDNDRVVLIQNLMEWEKTHVS